MMRAWPWMIALLLAVMTAGCTPAPTANELKVIKDMTSAMKTQCVGRYLFDLPESFVWGEFPEVELYYGLDENFKTVSVQIVDAHSSEEKFLERTSKRINEIARTLHNKTNASMLLAHREGSNSVFLEYYRTKQLTESKTYEAHILLGKSHVLLKADSFPEDTKSAEDIILKLSSQIHLMDDAQGHKVPGFCLGSLLIDADSDHEVLVKAYAKDKRRPDVKFIIYMSAITPDEGERLPDQIAREQVVFGTALHTLRKGETRLGSMAADEVLMRINDDDVVMHTFVARSLRPTPSLALPTISVRLQTGGEISSSPPPDLLKYGVDGDLPHDPSPRTVSASLTDNEAMGLWDAVMKSVRLRPDSVRAGK